MKLDFIIPGAQKAGTTALMHFLADHPKIGMPRDEIRSFSPWKRKLFCKDDFHQSLLQDYPDIKSKKLVGIKKPNVMILFQRVRSLYHYNPDIKLLILLRNPIERAFSHYNMRCFLLKNEAIDSFHQVIKEEIDVLESGHPECYEQAIKRYGYVSRGFYLRQLMNVEDFFSRKNVLVLLNEDLQYRHAQSLELICEFLGVTKYAAPPMEHGKGTYHNTMSNESKKLLSNYFREHTIALQDYLNRDLASWL